MCMAAVQQTGWALQYVPEELRDDKMCMAAVQQTGCVLQFVPEAVQLAHPDICVAAVQQFSWSRLDVPEELKTNVEALAKLYTTSEAQLISDLLSLEINDDVINQVICSLKAPIATSSNTIVELLGTGNDSKQPAEHPANSRDIITEHGLLTIMQEYVHTPSNQENDAKESDFTP